MTYTILNLDDLEPLEGTVETGGDSARFRSQTATGQDSLGGPLEGQLSIDDRAKRVVLENYRALSWDKNEGCEITLRRIRSGAN